MFLRTHTFNSTYTHIQQRPDDICSGISVFSATQDYLQRGNYNGKDITMPYAFVIWPQERYCIARPNMTVCKDAVSSRRLGWLSAISELENLKRHQNIISEVQVVILTMQINRLCRKLGSLISKRRDG